MLHIKKIGASIARTNVNLPLFSGNVNEDLL